MNYECLLQLLAKIYPNINDDCMFKFNKLEPTLSNDCDHHIVIKVYQDCRFMQTLLKIVNPNHAQKNLEELVAK